MKNYVEYLCADCDGDPWECAKTDDCVKHDCAAHSVEGFFKCEVCDEVKLDEEKCVRHYYSGDNVCMDCCDDCSYEKGYSNAIDNAMNEQKCRDIFGY